MFLSRVLRKETYQDPGVASAGSQQLPLEATRDSASSEMSFSSMSPAQVPVGRPVPGALCRAMGKEVDKRQPVLLATHLLCVYR